MSRLEELIQELCPNGVEYCPLSCLADIGTGSHNTNEELADGDFPFFVRSQDVRRLNTYDYDETAIITSGDGVGVGKIFHFINGKYALHQRAYRIHVTDERLMPEFYFHYMKATFYEYIQKTAVNSSVTSVRRPMLNKYPIPVPPLEVQREIVRKLDSFTLLTAELTEKLTAELTARKKQYEYYRDELLKPKTNIPIVRLDVQKRYAEVLDNFDAICSDLNIELPAEIEARQTQYEYYRDALLTFAETGKIIPRQTNEYNALIRLCQYVFGFVMLPLSEICNSISSGKAKTKDDIGKYPVYGSTGIIARTDNAVYNKMNILVARVGANAGYTHLAQGGYDVSDNTLIVDVKSEYSLKYIYYQLVNIGLNRYAKGGGQPLVTAGQIKEVVLPVPMKQEQDRIVEILDRFDSLCNDITTGLPAEIEARQKQYEFYRDKLLSFKQL